MDVGDDRGAAFDPRPVERFLRDRGAERLAHPGGTLYEHLRRVAELLREWGADPTVQLAGLCHACYGTDGYAHALVDAGDRTALRERIGTAAERLVYLYGSCDRAAVYPQLSSSAPVRFRDRFTGETHVPPQDDVRAFVELTAANELDALGRNPELAAAHGEALFAMLGSARHHLSDAGWRSWVEFVRGGEAAERPR